MQPSLAPTQVRTSSARPCRTLLGRSGSAMSARVITTMSIVPSAMTCSACAGSTMRPAWKIGRPGTAALIATTSGRKTPRGGGMVGAARACSGTVWGGAARVGRLGEGGGRGRPGVGAPADDGEEVHEPRGGEAPRDLRHVGGGETAAGHLVPPDARGPDAVAPDLAPRLT